MCAVYFPGATTSMVARSSREVMKRVDETIGTGSNPLWVPVRPSVKRATPLSKNAPRVRTTVNSRVGAVFRVVWYTSAIQECVTLCLWNTLRSHSGVLYGEVQDQPTRLNIFFVNNFGINFNF